MQCPICKCEEKTELYKLCDNMQIMGPAFPAKASFVAKCSRCGLVYMNTEATQEHFLDYYKNWAVAPRYYDMFGKEDTEDYYEHLLELLVPDMQKESSIIDIAGSWGEFAGYLITKGYRDVTVLDPNEKCIANAKEQGAKTILDDSVHMDVEKMPSYDVVILNHSLEHILDIEKTMNNIGKILKDAGTLFIEIPDAEGYVDEDAAPFNFFTYEHVVHMTMNDLENLAAAFGYEIIRKGKYYKKVSNYPSVYAVLKKGKKQTIHYSDMPENAVRAYIERSEKSIEQFIKPLRESGEELILWGIGASTTILLESFKGCNVIDLIDKNPMRQGLEFAINDKVCAVHAPEHVGDGTIVILSIPYHDSIEKQIRQMGLTNKIISLK